MWVGVGAVLVVLYGATAALKGPELGRLADDGGANPADEIDKIVEEVRE